MASLFKRWLPWAIVMLLLPTLAIVGATGAGLYHLLRWGERPYGEAGEKTLKIEPGTATREIGRVLEREGIIERESYFTAWLLLTEKRGRLQAGDYRLTLPISPSRLAERLSRGSFGRPLTIPEGWTARQIAQRLTREGWIDRPEQWLELVNRPLELPELHETLASGAEGFCFPETYRIEEGTTTTAILGQMLGEFTRQWRALEPERRGDLATSLTLSEVVTLASMIEREARRDDEMPLIASVYLNRLRRGMKLQCCATVHYALGEVWDRALTLDDLKIDSPYNTYRNAGLPPGPIANPGRVALVAVLRPAESNYLFYVYRGEGRHIFSATYKEHLAAIKEARKQNPQAEVTGQDE